MKSVLGLALMIQTTTSGLDAGELGKASQAGTAVVPMETPTLYPDGRPSARYRLAAADQGIVFRHGDGPNQCDQLGARDVWVWRDAATYYMHYDGAGPRGWLACLASSTDLTRWSPKGPALDLGNPGKKDSASASYGGTFKQGRAWHMFYLGTPNVTAPPDLIPGFPYLTMKAQGASPTGPWTKRYDITPFSPKPGTYYSATASPGHVIRRRDEYLMFFSASTDTPILRTLGIARTRNLDSSWTTDPRPIVPPSEQVENTSLYYEKRTRTWFLFTNHVGLKNGLEYTDAIWVYWTRDLERWDPARKAVVLDGSTCRWSKHIIGLPSVVQSGSRLAVFYEGNPSQEIPTGVKSHMARDVGLAWLELPLVIGKEAGLQPNEGKAAGEKVR